MRSVVTGATSGIGREFAIAFASLGHDLVVGGRRREMLEELAQTLRDEYGVDVVTVVGDLSLPETQERLEKIIASGPVAFLVNSAGAGLSGLFARTDPPKLTDLHTLLATVPMRLTRAALAGMLSVGQGTIINVGSLAGRLAVPRSSIYVAAKSYVERLSETLALELSEGGIVVQALLPGYVRTDFHREIPDYKSKQRNQGFIRWAEPSHVVNTSLAAAARARQRLQRNPSIVPRPRDVVVVVGFLNRALLVLSRFLPRRFLYRAAANRERLE